MSRVPNVPVNKPPRAEMVKTLFIRATNAAGGYDADADDNSIPLYYHQDPTTLTGQPLGAIIWGPAGRYDVRSDGVPRLSPDSDGSRADLIFDAATELTIATGAITVTQGSHTVDTEADAASDNLDTISGMAAEEVVLLRPASAARTVVLRDFAVGAGNIFTPGQQSISLAEAADWALAVSDGTNVVIVAYRTQALGGGGLGAALASVANALGASLVGVEDAATLFTAVNVEAALAESAVKIAALGAENTDGQIEIPLTGGISTSGTWTPAMTSAGAQTLTRTAGAATEYHWLPIPIPTRSTASKGIKPTGADVNYSVNTADATDITFEIWKLVLGADGAAPTASVLFGDADADYDANHDTAAKRGDDTGGPELHRAILTDAGTPAYVGVDDQLWLRIKVIDPGTSAVVVTAAKLRFSETLVDLA